MPDGLDTMLYRDFDPHGVVISGGEAQKIAIARALYKNAPFLVLDEPTAALDPVSEYEVYRKFNAISGGKTALYISHRLASCRFCDEILVFSAGSIVQHGTHEALLQEKTENMPASGTRRRSIMTTFTEKESCKIAEKRMNMNGL